MYGTQLQGPSNDHMRHQWFDWVFHYLSSTVHSLIGEDPGPKLLTTVVFVNEWKGLAIMFLSSYHVSIKLVHGSLLTRIFWIINLLVRIPVENKQFLLILPVQCYRLFPNDCQPTPLLCLHWEWTHSLVLSPTDKFCSLSEFVSSCHSCILFDFVCNIISFSNK